MITTVQLPLSNGWELPKRLLPFWHTWFYLSWRRGSHKTPALTSPIYRFYGLFLLANLIYETSIGVLQVTDRFKRVAFANVLQSILTAALIILAFFMQWGLFEIIMAYLAGKTIAAIIITYFAIQSLNA